MIGCLSETTGKRPSAFFEWNNEDEWQDRLFFDLYILTEYKKEEERQMNHSKRH